MFKTGDRVKIDERCSVCWWYTKETFTIICAYKEINAYGAREKYILNTIVGNSNSKFGDEIRKLTTKELRKEKILTLEKL